MGQSEGKGEAFEVSSGSGIAGVASHVTGVGLGNSDMGVGLGLESCSGL